MVVTSQVLLYSALLYLLTLLPSYFFLFKTITVLSLCRISYHRQDRLPQRFPKAGKRSTTTNTRNGKLASSAHPFSFPSKRLFAQTSQRSPTPPQSRFYVNIYTKQSQWDRPTEPVYPSDSASAPSGAPPSYTGGGTGMPEKSGLHSNNPYSSGGAGGNSSSNVNDDAAFAAKLQAEEDARAAGRPTSRGMHLLLDPTHLPRVHTLANPPSSPKHSLTPPPFSQAQTTPTTNNPRAANKDPPRTKATTTNNCRRASSKNPKASAASSAN